MTNVSQGIYTDVIQTNRNCVKSYMILFDIKHPQIRNYYL